jgi:ABC-2 type transport system ATP-binding protein
VLVERAADGVPVMFSSHQLSLVEHVCDRVGIVVGGRLVACGTLAELSGNAHRYLLVDAPRAGANWATGLAGVEVVSREGTSTRLRLTEDADDQEVLRAALATGPVSTFVSEYPSLTELYRDVVTRANESGQEDGAEMVAANAPESAGKTADNRIEGEGR